MSTLLVPAALTLGLAATAPVSGAEKFDELAVLVEINATDGDAGFHALLDADAWDRVRVDNPNGKKIFEERAKRNLRKQGLTENFFESSEPLCIRDKDEPDEEVVPLGTFLKRFPAGDYAFSGKTLEGDNLKGKTELTHDLPAAPDIAKTDEKKFGAGKAVVIQWAGGSDLGNCHDDDLVDDGTIPNPMMVEVVRWEVVVEPEDEDAVDPLRVLSVQIPGGDTVPLKVTVPPEFLDAYVAEGVREFKFEVGARESSGNQTFSEGTFEIKK
jgi:hypothetical protein